MTRSFSFMQVDAFTEKPLGGNPCAILFDTDELDAATMQAIAQENNLSETSFVRKSDIADVRVRYFTPSAEIPLAGHPTIATAFALVDSGRIKPAGDYLAVTFELNVGPITVELFSKEGRLYRAVMSQKKPQFFETFDAAQVMPMFGLLPEDAIENAPIQTVSTGTKQLMVCVKSLDALQRMTPASTALHRFHENAGIFSAHVFTREGATLRGQTFARHIAPGPNEFEDPFTGSATGGMAAYLWHHGLIDSPTFIAEQGHWMRRPGEATVEVIGPRHDIETVKVGGSAVTVIRGMMEIGR